VTGAGAAGQTVTVIAQYVQTQKHALSVVNGLGTGRVAEGSTRTVEALPAPVGMAFDQWLGPTATPFAAVAQVPVGASDAFMTALYRTVPAPLGYHTLAPCRVLDTRKAAGPDAASPALGAGESRAFAVVGRCGIPASAKAISVNLATVQAQAAGSMVLFPGDEPAPVAAMLNFPAAGAKAGNGLAKVSAGGTVAAVNRSAGTAHLILDVSGWFE
jgi:hypothetical protein